MYILTTLEFSTHNFDKMIHFMIHWFILFDEDGMLETLDFAFYIGSTSTFLSFHLSSCSVH